ncbi:MAG: DUF4180 domain-containing protein [Clostridiales bacterium]|nr:DUF4180 domain-containing protein [Clostridiales bacterium]
MDILYRTKNNKKVAILTGKGDLIRHVSDILDIMVQIQYNECDRMIVRKENLPAEFFELKTGLAGEILQKLVNYNTKIAIVGEFECIKSKSLHDFIYECNKGKHVFFKKNAEDALEALVRV